MCGRTSVVKCGCLIFIVSFDENNSSTGPNANVVPVGRIDICVDTIPLAPILGSTVIDIDALVITFNVVGALVEGTRYGLLTVMNKGDETVHNSLGTSDIVVLSPVVLVMGVNAGENSTVLLYVSLVIENSSPIVSSLRVRVDKIDGVNATVIITPVEIPMCALVSLIIEGRKTVDISLRGAYVVVTGVSASVNAPVIMDRRTSVVILKCVVFVVCFDKNNESIGIDATVALVERIKLIVCIIPLPPKLCSSVGNDAALVMTFDFVVIPAKETRYGPLTVVTGVDDPIHDALGVTDNGE